MFQYKRELRIFLYILFFTVIFLFILKYANVSPYSSNEKLKGGKLDLTEFNFKSDSINLDGEWDFYFDKFLYSDDFSKLKKPPSVTLRPWKDLGYNNIGKGTYRALITKEPDITELALKFSNVYTSYELYINNQLVKGIGTAYNNHDDIKIISDFHIFNCEGSSLEIIIHVMNDDFYIGGITSPPILGIPKNIQITKDLNLSLSVFFIASLLCTSIFIFSFYIAREEESSIIFLALSAISYVLKIFLSIDGPMYFLYYTVPYNLLNKFLIAFGMLSVYFIFEYFNNTFKRRKNIFTISLRTAVYIYIATIFLAGTNHMYYINIISIVLTSLIYFYSFIIACTDLVMHQSKAIFNFSGSIILLISFSLDIDNMTVSRYRIMGLFIFCILALSNVIKDYITTYSNLKQIKNNLETEVKNRTAELIEINDSLKKETKARITAEENLKSIPNYDNSTGLFNELYARNYIDGLISYFYRHNQVFSIIIFEINDLAVINQTFNEELSKKVVLESTSAIKFLLRKTDILARWNDNKFIVIMPNCSEKSAISVSEKINISISENIIEDYGNVTVSLGVSTLRDNDNSDTVVKRAEINQEQMKEFNNLN